MEVSAKARPSSKLSIFIGMEKDRGTFMQAKDSAVMAYSAEPQVLTVSVLKSGAMSVLQSLADLRLISIKKEKIVSAKKSLKEAAKLLCEDYRNDKNLTEFTQLDSENFYETK